ncbi:MAG: glycosyltransferase [Bacteroidales bacterium]|nr:glycosyltransferase [Bacteroidales bacterium]
MDGKDKIKVLFLSTHDSPLEGHAFSICESLPKDKFDARLFVLHNSNGKTKYSLIGSNSIIVKFYHKLLNLYLKVHSLLKYGKIPCIKRGTEYCYYSDDFVPSYSGIILRRLKGFVPDVICVTWVAKFISSATIKNLYKKTHAKIILFTTDEQFMMGGCHYSVECSGFKTGCFNCPALSKFRDYSHYQIENKKNNYKDIPITIRGVPYAVEKAVNESYLFSENNCNKILTVKNTTQRVIETPKLECRKAFGIKDDAFVIFCAASHIDEKRKGFVFTIDALHKFQKTINNSIVLVAGNVKDDSIFKGLNYILTGRLTEEKLFEGYCASDCFLSTTIADTGPMMVNFSMSLGIPVVSFKIGVAASLVIHKKTGYIAKYKDVEDVNNGLLYIHSLSEAEYSEMKNNCKLEISKYSNNIDYLNK